MKTARKLIIGCALGIAAVGAVVALDAGGLLDRFERQTWDMRVSALADEGDPRIKLILLDQPSLTWMWQEQRLGWPWPREVYGPIIEFCRRGGARAIAFDVLFTEPSNEPADDERLGEAFASASNLVAAMLPSARLSEATEWPDEIPDNPFQVGGLEEWIASHPHADLTAPRAVFSIPKIASGAPFHGHVRGAIDIDNVIRRAYPLQVFDGQVVPMLGLAAYCAGDPAPPRMTLDRRWLRIGDRRLPIDATGRTVLRYRRITTESSHPYPAYSAAGVIESFLMLEEGRAPKIDPRTFHDAYVLFGFSAPGLYDLKPSPLSPAWPGVVTHATLLDNVLNQDSIRDAPRGATVAFMLLLAAFGATWSVIATKARQVVLGIVILLPLPIATGVAAYEGGYWWPIAAPQLAVALAMVGGVIVNYATEGRQRRFIRSAFGQYLSPQVIDQIVADPAALRLGGEDRELTVFFSDIEKFSTFCHKLDAPTITALLNDYLSEMTAIIFEEGGTLDKFIGDAIVAFWNAPTDQPDHAARAVRAALRCQRRLAERRDEFTRRLAGQPLRMRIGLHTGRMVVGNLGSAERFAYTVLGDAANLASRLEGANKAFGTYTLVSRETWSRTNGQFVGRALGTITVVGRDEPVEVVEPLGFATDPQNPAISQFEHALHLCNQGRAAEALPLFEQLPHDPAAQSYAQLLRTMPPEERARWIGIWSLMEK